MADPRVSYTVDSPTRIMDWTAHAEKAGETSEIIDYVVSHAAAIKWQGVTVGQCCLIFDGVQPNDDRPQPYRLTVTFPSPSTLMSFYPEIWAALERNFTIIGRELPSPSKLVNGTVFLVNKE